MPTLLGIHGSVTYPGRLYQALDLALQSAANQWETVTTSLLHLGDHQISFADGRPLPDYSDDTEAVVQRVMDADMYLIGTPIFRASFTASLKNLLDLVPVEGLMGKVCGLVAPIASGDHHYLSVDTQLRPVLAWFGAHLVPGGVYLQSRQFQDGKLADPGAIAALGSLTNAVITMQQAVAGNSGMMGPSPLAAG
ncbi:MAG: NAD(P)H-dependent oxidoreductase [Chloroflexi bacterium]|nr:NAD(P)H-dependent oxidoreductase [Chloroflexota bacterium]